MNYDRYASVVDFELIDGIATVTFNRPERRNAIATDVHSQLEQLWLDMAGDDQIRVIILTGAGSVFSAGGNIKEMASIHGTPDGYRTALHALSAGPRLLNNLLSIQQPIIAAVNGDAIGLGATLALFCDIVVMNESAMIGDTHVRVGLSAGDGGAVIWPMLVGMTKAKEMLMRGRLISGTEAERINLVNYAVPADAVLAKAWEIAEDLASLPPIAVRFTKRPLNQVVKQQFNLAMDSSFGYEMMSMLSDDHLEALQSILEKRKACSTGNDYNRTADS
jgi:enoyl-CoA hydratase